MTVIASRGQLRASFIRWSLFTVPLVVLLGFVSGQLGSPNTFWFQSLVKPEIFPPPVTFGIVWTILYIMIGLALVSMMSVFGASAKASIDEQVGQSFTADYVLSNAVGMPFSPGVTEQLRDVQGVEQVDAGFDLAAHAGQDAAAFHGGGPAPFAFEGGTRGADGGVHVGGGSSSQSAHDLAHRRVLDRQGRAAACGTPDAADEDHVRRKGRDHCSVLIAFVRRRQRYEKQWAQLLITQQALYGLALSG